MILARMAGGSGSLTPWSGSASHGAPSETPAVLATRSIVVLSFVSAMALVAVASVGHDRSTKALGAVLALLLVVLAFMRTKADSTTLLIFCAAVLLLVPSRLILAALGGAGTPAALLALLGGWLWFMAAFLPQLGSVRGVQPVRYAIFFYLATVVTSYIAAATRGVDVIEARAADRGIFIVLSAASLALLAADGIRTRARLEALLRALVLAGCGLAAVGILQFTVGFDLASMIRIPGLSVDELNRYESITSRSEFNRVAGTTFHPIEFSAVLTMLLPIALHFTYAAPAHRRRRWWVAVAVLAAAIPMSVSRTGTVGLVAVALVLFPTWTGRRRRQAIWAGAAFAVAMKILVPGLLGTIRALFLSFGVDPSITARRIDYGYITEFISERPLLGRGFGTFLPSRYDFLDNQFLLALVETGAIGLVALVMVFAVGMSLVRGARRRSADPATRDLAQSLFASILVALITCATFDFLSFPTARSLAFLLIGCSGALWRLEREGQSEAGPDISVHPHQRHSLQEA